jgi:arylsulfatase A-like enzyme
MNLKVILIVILAFCLSTNLMGLKPNLRNVIIISVDTLRADHLGCYGYPLNTSPVIDEFSKDGILFSNCYALTPLTAPSFATLLTSLPAHKHGAKRNGLSIYKNIKTLPYYLKKYRYHTAAFISNWPIRKKLSGLNNGFDEYYHIFTKKRYLGILNSEGTAPAVTEKTLRWIQKNHKKRFFLWVQYTDPHALYYLHKNFTFNYQQIKPSTYPQGTRMKKIKGYDSEIAFTDYHIGKVIKELKRFDLYDDAIIIFHSDHGESFGEHNYLKHGRKLYNSTLHVPLIIKLPKKLNANTKRKEVVTIMDIGPTLFSILQIPKFPQMEGLNVFSSDASLFNRKIFFEAYGGTVIFRRNSQKYHIKIKPIRYGTLSRSKKLIYNIKKKTFEFYDLKLDHFESQNIFSQPSMVVDDAKQNLLSKIDQIKEYIKLNRQYRLNGSALSQEDLNKLKSLGYFEDE